MALSRRLLSLRMPQGSHSAYPGKPFDLAMTVGKIEREIEADRFDEAAIVLRKAIDIDSSVPGPYLSLIAIETISPEDDKLVGQLNTDLRSPFVPDQIYAGS